MHLFRPSHIALLSSMLMAMAPLSGVANAQDGKDKKRVLLMPVERGDSVLSVVPREVAESLRTILSNNRTIEIVRPSDLKKPEVELVAEKPKAKVKDKILVKADRALWDAKELAGKEKYLSSAKLFKKAMAYYEKRFDKLVDFDKYVDAALGVSLSYFFAGYDDNGEDALAPVMILKPTTVLQRRKVPKAAMEALERLRKLYSKASSGRIRIESNPPGAIVYVDGVLRGQTPTMVSGLWRGQHVLRLTRDGFNPVAKRFTASGRQQTLSAKMKPVRVAAAKKKKKKKGKEAQGPSQIMELVTKSVKTGKFGHRFSNAASILAKEYGLSSIVMPYVRRAGRKYDLAAFFYDASVKRVAELEWISFAADLADMQSKLLRVEEQVLQGLVIFPRSRVVSRRKKSKIYEAFEVPAPPAPKVVAKPPAPSPMAKRSPAPVISPKPSSKPAPVAKAPVPIRVKRPSPGRIKPIPSVSPAPPVARPAPVAPPAPRKRRAGRNSDVLRPVAPPSYGSPRPVAPAQPSRGGFRPTPAPVYAPSPAPVYAPRPAPVYAPRPATAPAPVYAPRPAPAPVYAPRPAPAPVYAPRPTPAPLGAPQPIYAPKPIGPSFDPSSPAPIPDSSSMVTTPWYNKWWVWAIIGGGVVGATGMVIGLTSGDDVPPGFRTVVSWGSP